MAIETRRSEDIHVTFCFEGEQRNGVIGRSVCQYRVYFKKKIFIFTIIAYVMNEKCNTERNNLVLSGHMLNV